MTSPRLELRFSAGEIGNTFTGSYWFRLAVPDRAAIGNVGGQSIKAAIRLERRQTVNRAPNAGILGAVPAPPPNDGFARWISARLAYI
jgi:hypothetical protein